MRNFNQPFSGAQAELLFSGDIASGSPNKIAVQRVQEWLVYHGKATGVDEDYGQHTKALVTAFQSGHALPATGVVNSATWAALTAPLRRALRPVDPAGKSLNDLIVAYARQNLAENPIEIGGPNDGPWVRSYMLGRGGKIWQWCAGFVSFVLAQACQAKGVKLPIEPSFSVRPLVKSATPRGRFFPDGPFVPGDIFCIPTANGSWSHTGFVLELAGDKFLSAEGNTNAAGGSDGVCARSTLRNPARCDFIRVGT